MSDHDDKLRAFKRRQRKLKDKKKRLDKPDKDTVVTSYHRVRLDPRHLDKYQEDDDVLCS